MIRLDATTRKLQVLLAGAITTNQLPVVASWSDAATTTYVGGVTPSNTNSTTAVDIVAAPAASTIRDVDYINIRNADTVAATVTVRLNDNATTYDLIKATLAVGDVLTYAHSGGWSTRDSNGALKQELGNVSTFMLTVLDDTTAAAAATTLAVLPLTGGSLAGNLYISFASVGGTAGLEVFNSNNSNGASNAIIDAKVGGSSGGDPYVALIIEGLFGWTMAVDNSDSDKLKIGPDLTVGTNTIITMTTGGSIGIGPNSGTVDTYSGNVDGFGMTSGGAMTYSRTSGDVVGFNRKTTDGNILLFGQDGATEGTVSVSGTTVTYSSFCGGHWSQLSGGVREEFLRGTIMSTIDERCEWPGEDNEQLPRCKVSDMEGDIRAYGVFMAWDEDEKAMITKKVKVLREQEAVEQVNGVWKRVTNVQEVYENEVIKHVVYESDGVTPVFTVVPEERNPYTGEVLRSETRVQKFHYENVMVRKKGTNDMTIAGLGQYKIRMRADQPVQCGYVESAGDGTGRFQADQLLATRRTVAEVNCAVVIETYPDGSFTMPARLMKG